MTKKYNLTDETKNVNGHVLHRIQALCEIQTVFTSAGADNPQQATNLITIGTKGGWIESEQNLSQEGNCWVGDEAEVYGNAQVFDNAVVVEKAQVFGNAKIFSEAVVAEQAKVYDNAIVCSKVAYVGGTAQIFGNAIVGASGELEGEKDLDLNLNILGNARVFGNAVLAGRIWILIDRGCWFDAEHHVRN